MTRLRAPQPGTIADLETAHAGGRAERDGHDSLEGFLFERHSADRRYDSHAVVWLVEDTSEMKGVA